MKKYVSTSWILNTCTLICFTSLLHGSPRDTIIHYLDSHTIGSGEYTISESGYYLFTTDVFVNAALNTAALTINADYVTIDLNSKTLTQTSANTNVIGIKINSNKHHVSIINGDVTNFTGYQVSFAGTSGNYIHDCTLSGCRMTGGQRALNLEYVKDLTAKNCFCTRAFIGCYLDNCEKCLFYSTHFDDNYAENNDAAGVYGSTVKSLLFDSCTFNNNQSDIDGNGYGGLKLENSTGSIINNCRADNNSCRYAPCAGISLKDCQGTIIQSSICNSNSSEYLPCYGIGLAGTIGCKVMRATAMNNSSLDDDCCGIALITEPDIPENNLLEDCTVLANLSKDANGYGIGVDSSASKTIILRCKAFANSSSGIDNNSSTSVIVACAAGSNGTNTNYTGSSSASALLIAPLGSGTQQISGEYDNVDFKIEA